MGHPYSSDQRNEIDVSNSRCGPRTTRPLLRLVLFDVEGYYAPFFVAAGPGQDYGASVSGEVLWLECGLVGFELEGRFSG